MNNFTAITRKMLGIFIYRFLTFPSAFLAVAGLVMLIASIITVNESARETLRSFLVLARAPKTISFSTEDVFRLIGTSYLVLAVIFEVLRLVRKKQTNYRAYERRVRFLLMLSWPIFALVLHVSGNTDAGIWLIALVILAIGWIIIGVESLTLKLADKSLGKLHIDLPVR